MKPQPYKKALLYLDKAENLQNKSNAHLREVKMILIKMSKEEKTTPKIKTKKNRTI